MFIRMSVIEMTLILLLFVTLSAVAEQLDAWGEGGRDISSQNSRSTWQEAKDYASGVINGAKEMHRAYNDMKEANWKNSDKYFHARGNADAAKHGTGGRHAAKVISDLREVYGLIKGDSAADIAADQNANKHGRNGGDPNKYRPEGLPKKFVLSKT
ncbi:serum amyloid A-5 protein-like [Ruditapes philippinarum]|uniref:serum amyloid A-5 protein-like n=1 Tax=Ruditapes philippinarum TaxID=129788 RepID=UPI00295C16C0|nr:serum amyloid A-5 protein-like [Ruditapes philippinarum]